MHPLDHLCVPEDAYVPSFENQWTRLLTFAGRSAQVFFQSFSGHRSKLFLWPKKIESIWSEIMNSVTASFNIILVQMTETLREKKSRDELVVDTDKSREILNIQGVHKVLHTLKIFISQKPHKVETLHCRQWIILPKVCLLFFTGYFIVKISKNKSFSIKA